MHPLTLMDATSPKIVAERVALVRDIMIGMLSAFALAGLPIWTLYAVLRVLQLLR
jgi:hypothetical protein